MNYRLYSQDKRRTRVRYGRISSGRTWRTSTAIPNAICRATWVPLRFLAWTVLAIAALMRTVILAIATIIGILLVISGALVGWQEGTLGIICLICAGAVVISLSGASEDWKRS